MRAIRVHAAGGPEVLEIEDVPVPEPGPGEVRVRIAAVGVNFIDTYQRSGAYATATPFTPGSEAAGMVSALGPGVTDVQEGTTVAYAMVRGAYAEEAIVPADRVVPVPGGVESTAAAAVMLQGMTAHYLAISTVALKEGDRVLIHAAAGGVGLLLTQIAKRRGAVVYGTVSTEEKAELASGAGADVIIRYTETDFRSAVEELTDGRGVDVVYDSVGRDTFDDSLASLRPRGHLVLFGQSSGPVPPLDPQRLNSGGSLYLTRPSLAHYTATRQELLHRAGEVLGWVADGSLRVRIGETHRLEDAPVAHQRLESRQTTGKVLLLP